jgi:hypothetical protein
VSRIDSIDLASLRCRLSWALARKQDAGFDSRGSIYLLCLGACWLTCSTPEEEERLEDLYYSQAREEGIGEIDDVTSALILAGGAK